MLFEFRHLLRIPRHLSYAPFLGGAYHYAIGKGYDFKKYTGKFLSIPEVTDLFSDAWETRQHVEDEAEKQMEIDFEGEDPGKIKDEGYGLVVLHANTKGKVWKPKEVEFSFVRDFPDFTFIGRIDLILAGEGDRIIDHKTGKRAKSQREVELNLQPYSYALGLDREISFTFSTAIRKTRPEIQDLSVTRTREHIDWYVREVVIPTLRSIQTGIFPPRPGASIACPCAYRQLCNPYLII